MTATSQRTQQQQNQEQYSNDKNLLHLGIIGGGEALQHNENTMY